MKYNESVDRLSREEMECVGRGIKSAVIILCAIALVLILARCLWADEDTSSAIREQTRQEGIQYLHDQNDRYAAESRESFRRM